MRSRRAQTLLMMRRMTRVKMKTISHHPTLHGNVTHWSCSHSGGGKDGALSVYVD